MNAVEWYRVAPLRAAMWTRDAEIKLRLANVAIAELEADRDEWMAEWDLNLLALIKSRRELAEFKSRHTGGGCGMGAATGDKP